MKKFKVIKKTDGNGKSAYFLKVRFLYIFWHSYDAWSEYPDYEGFESMGKVLNFIRENYISVSETIYPEI